ncbi:TPA: phage replisome organizer N-terminal domain-containing protein [Streptococcus agalactiae]|uniref:phage replisome organizer N-terminal domain-containing protein n=1 Tax=Streptococcus agalactiae TaxID=1311 RepID=UPI000B6EA8DB|nr:phage replisome organizer N-terminal domain-containing protein [Streptococcus agalactiae]OTG59122.1 prephenate dehydrogenase [Streptococcus agalactiae]RRA75507.1 DnaD domain protein [Streptococcus agalactiae]RRA76197.1 DnaD domain protein [Streptococcus agalactiae]HEO6662938.1 phage replisome organizer N-terminal domain-containing protein [Streptococcus agalactiae]HEO6667011.1 phage replisome organizer N-terminal domain-containing protein [Streptococcus agalactiae]
MADNKKYYYLKLKENFFESDEAIILESMPDGYIYSNILLKLYLRSLKNDGLLMFNNLIPYNAQMLATITRHQVGTIEKAIRIFKDLQLIEVLDNGAIYMTNIQNFVGKSSSQADYMRNYREKKGGLTNVNQNSYICEPEIEIEKKKDKERELDKDIDIESEVEEEIKDSSPASENSLKIISDYFQQEIGILSPNQLEQLSDYITFTKMEVDVVKEAITRAADNSKRSFGYVNSILRNWRQNGILTMVKVEEEQRQFESKKNNSYKAKGQRFSQAELDELKTPDPKYGF